MSPVPATTTWHVTEGTGSSSAPGWPRGGRASAASSDSDVAPWAAPCPHLSQVSISGKLSSRRKVRLRNLSSLAAEWMLDEELRSSFSAWLRLPRLLQGEASTGWLGSTACFRCSCRDGLEEPSARGWAAGEGADSVCATHSESVSGASVPRWPPARGCAPNLLRPPQTLGPALRTNLLPPRPSRWLPAALGSAQSCSSRK